MIVIQCFLTTLAALLAVPVAIYCVEIVASCWPGQRTGKCGSSIIRPRIAVLVPAHNEQAGLPATLQSIAAQLLPDDRLIVIADNCTDQTAAVARALGVAVLERRDEVNRGKGFALAFGLDQLRTNPPEVVLFFDADCRLAEGTIQRLATVACVQQHPVQALYLCEATSAGGPQNVVSSLAFRFKNLVRTLGMARLGGTCHLTGSGMGLPWKLVDEVAWATGNVVEDMQLGIDLTLAGYPPLFVPEAIVTSDLPESQAGMLAQRRRWEHGFLMTALTQIPQLLGQSCIRRSWPLFLLALDLAIPPLALLTLGLVAAWCAAMLSWLIGLGALPLMLMTGAGLAFWGATLLAWAVHCRKAVPIKAVWQVPSYLLAKVPLYAAFLWRRQQIWVRAERSAR